MPDPIHLIPLAEIDDKALPRDRTGLAPEPLRELRNSILKSGLRMPVELFELANPAGPRRYGILSGFRRIAAFRELNGIGIDHHDTIPAFLRAPADSAAAFAAMVEENAIRADLSPWEQGRIAVTARDTGIFSTIEEAVDRLYPAASAVKRTRLRSLARVAEFLDGTLATPETLSERQLLRLASALRNNFGETIETALRQTAPRDPANQWAAILPYLVESERLHATDPEPDAPTRETRGRPRRILRPRPHLSIRREIARDGYILRFTGREATSSLLDEVLDEIERLYSPG